MILPEDQKMVETVFLALMLWRETRGEGDSGITGVAQVVLNRVKHQGWMGKTIQEVLFLHWQFSSLTNKKDKQLTTWPKEGSSSWERCFRIAKGAIEGVLPDVVGTADSYYDDSIPAPKWATRANFIVKIENLNFHDVNP